jgi:O-antigen ligase
MTAIVNARTAAVETSIENIRMHPWTGIGYGVPSNLDVTLLKYDPVLGLPISAPMEKGIIYIAVVEELGILGTGLFVALILTMIAPAFAASSPSAVCLVCACLASNLAEASLLAFGGHGLLQWS